jgi:hypothetical protein
MDEYPELASAGLVMTVAAVLLVFSHLFIAFGQSEHSLNSASSNFAINDRVASYEGRQP